MKCISFMLGKGLLKKEKSIGSKLGKVDKANRRLRKKVAVEVFLREILGTHLIEKKY